MPPFARTAVLVALALLAADPAAARSGAPHRPAIGVSLHRLQGTDAALTVCPTDCPYKTIQAALDVAAPGDGIFVGNGVYAERLVVRTSVAIRGVDPVVTVIDAGQAGSAIKVERGVGATISGFKITGGKAASGAGIHNEGALFLFDSLVEGNVTDDPAAGYGGGIFNYGGSMTLSGVTIRGNRAEIGGGVLNSFGSTSIVRATIEQNTANQFGAGVFNGGNARLNADTLHLKGNDVGAGRGGGLYNAGFAYIQRSTLEGNRSEENGGAVYQFGDVTVLSNSTVSGNFAGFGGSGVYVNAGAMLITNATFANNSGGFGALFSLPPGETQFDMVRLRNTLMADNAGNSCYGFLASLGFNIDSANSCGFKGEKDQINVDPMVLPLADNGGSLPTHGLRPGSPAIDRGDPAGCAAPDDTLLTTDQRGWTRPVDGNGDGQAVCDVGSFEYSDQRLAPTPTPPAPITVPGAIQVCPSGCPHTTIQSAIDAAKAGDTIAIRAGTYREQLKVGKSLVLAGAGADHSMVEGDNRNPVLEVASGVQATVRDISLTRGAGIINQGDLTLERGRLAYHSGSMAGGVHNTGRLRVVDTEFQSNVSLFRGGGIHNDGGTLEVTRGRFSDNTSAIDGGAIYSRAGELTVRDSQFNGNLGRYGGAINSREAKTVLTGNRFEGNIAENGGAVFANAGSVALSGGSMERNRADLGGALYHFAAVDAVARRMDVSDTVFAENLAEGDFGFGGAVVANGGDLHLSRSRLVDNQARTGGAVYAYQLATVLTFGDLVVERNSAGRGGALYVDGSRVTVTSSRFVQNAASIDGGAMNLNRGPAKLEGLTLSSNTASLDGGALYIGEVAADGEPILGLALKIESNAAARHGGGVAVGGKGKLRLEASSLRLNEVSSEDGLTTYGGGALVQAGAELTVRRSTFYGNVASLGGGIAYSGTLLADNSTLVGNQARAGAGIYGAAGSARVASATIARNEATTVEGETPGAAGIELAQAATLNLANSIVALGLGGSNCVGTLQSGQHNIDGDGSCGLRAAGDKSEVDPGLLALADNGGGTETVDLLAGSEAIDAGNPAGCREAGSQQTLDSDQRGLKRAVDGNGDGQARCDIGAVEHGQKAVPTEGPDRIFLPVLRKES